MSARFEAVATHMLLIFRKLDERTHRMAGTFGELLPSRGRLGPESQPPLTRHQRGERVVAEQVPRLTWLLNVHAVRYAFSRNLCALVWRLVRTSANAPVEGL